MTPESKYVPGQVWNYKTRPGENNSTLMILKIEYYRFGTTIHIQIDNVRLTDLQGDQIADTISHAPITEEDLDQSVTRLVRQESQIPDFEEQYGDWVSNNGGTFTMSVAEVVAILEETWNKGKEVN